LLNAVLHGGAQDSSEGVACFVRRLRNGVRIHIADGGGGFDWRNCQAPPAPVAASSGRGLSILHTYSKEIRFNSRGNIVEIVREFRRPNGTRDPRG